MNDKKKRYLKQKEQLSIEEVQDELVTLYVVGHETTANVICWGLFLLGYNFDIQQKSKFDIKKKMEGKKEIEYEDLRHCDILLPLVHEIMRAIPIVPIKSRVAVDDVMLGDKYKVPKGTYLWNIDKVYDYKTFDPYQWNNITEIDDIAVPFGKRP
eukprot:UN10652